MPEIIDENSDAAGLIKDEIYHERSLTRCLLEFGLKQWEQGKTVADYILNEYMDEETIEDMVLKKIISTYKVWYDERPGTNSKKFFIFR